MYLKNALESSTIKSQQLTIFHKKFEKKSPNKEVERFTKGSILTIYQ